MQREIVFLRRIDVERIHRHELRYGGLDGLRSPGALEAALGAPRRTFGGRYLHEDLAAMTAAYMLSLIANHPFIDGNKRTAAAVVHTFLLLNDILFEPDEADFEAMVLATAKGETTHEHLARVIRDHIGSIPTNPEV